MGFLSFLLGVLGFCVGLPIGLTLGFFLFVYSKPKDVKEPNIISIEELEPSALQSLLPEIPYWIKSPDYERVDWLNTFIFDLWPYLDKAISNTIPSIAKPLFEEYIGQYHIQEIKFENISLGTLPPTLHGMKIYETNENQIVMEPAVKWAGNPNIVVVIRLMSVEIKIQLVDLQVFATPRIHLKPLVPTFPCFTNVVVSLMEKPHVDFGLNVLGGDVMSIPGLYSFVQETIKKEVANLYHWPQYLEIPILDASTTIKKPVGILHVNVVRAIKLLKADFLGASDPYVKLKLRGEKVRSKRTSIKKKTLNPEWKECFKITVKDPETQVLELHVYDWDKVGGHDSLGVQVVPLKQLAPSETKEFTLDLVKDFSDLLYDDSQNKKPRGQLVLELTFNPFKFDTTESFKTSSFREFERKQSSMKSSDSDDNEPLIESGVLIVTIIEASNVEGENHTNPYVLILFRGDKRKTQTVRKNRNPRWNEDFEFMLEEPPIKEKLLVEVFSKHKTIGFFRKESLGYVEIALADVVHNGRINDKYHLINSKNGIIQVKIEWQTT